MKSERREEDGGALVFVREFFVEVQHCHHEESRWYYMPVECLSKRLVCALRSQVSSVLTNFFYRGGMGQIFGPWISLHKILLVDVVYSKYIQMGK